MQGFQNISGFQWISCVLDVAQLTACLLLGLALISSRAMQILLYARFQTSMVSTSSCKPVAQVPHSRLFPCDFPGHSQHLSCQNTNSLQNVQINIPLKPKWKPFSQLISTEYLLYLLWCKQNLSDGASRSVNRMASTSCSSCCIRAWNKSQTGHMVRSESHLHVSTLKLRHLAPAEISISREAGQIKPFSTCQLFRSTTIIETNRNDNRERKLVCT